MGVECGKHGGLQYGQTQQGRELLVLLSLSTNETASLVSLYLTQAFEICLET